MLTHNPQVLYYSSHSAPITIFHLLVQITLYLGPTSGCPKWPYQPALQLAADLSVKIGVSWDAISWPHYLVTVGAGAYEARRKDGSTAQASPTVSARSENIRTDFNYECTLNRANVFETGITLKNSCDMTQHHWIRFQDSKNGIWRAPYTLS